MGVKVDVMDEFYKLLHPCLAVFVVSASAGGRPNLMTCAWNMPVSRILPWWLWPLATATMGGSC